MIAEAVDTVVTLGWALAAWIALLAVVAGLALYALVVAVWALWRMVRAAWTAAGLRTRSTAPLAAEQPAPVPESPGTADARSQPQPRTAPSWARTDKEAA